MSGIAAGSLSSVPNGQIIAFEEAELRRVPFQESLYLWVKGTLPASNIEVRLAPRVYHGRPDYWGIEVAATMMPDFAASGASDDLAQRDDLLFERFVPLNGITGFRGITVIGANKVQRIEIDGESF